jgi:hypothetical protein
MSPHSKRVRHALGARRRRLAAACGGLLVALMWISPTSATIIFKEHYSDDYAFSYDCDGTTIEVSGHDDGVAHIRVGKGALGTAFFAHDDYSFTETHTNPDGDFLVITANALFQETKATHVSGSIFTFSSVVSGQPFTVFDSNGKVLVRDRGAIRETILFDTLGDNMPGGTFIDSVSFDVAGPHDGLGFDTGSILG